MFKDRIFMIVTTVFLISLTSCLDSNPISQDKSRSQPTKRTFITKPKITPVENPDVATHRIHPQGPANSDQSINVSLSDIVIPMVIATTTPMSALPNTIAPFPDSTSSSPTVSFREEKAAKPKLPTLATRLAVPLTPKPNQMLSSTSTSSPPTTENRQSSINPLHQAGDVSQRIDPVTIPVDIKNTIDNGERQTIRGLLVEVSAGSLKEIGTLVLEDEFGDRHSFIAIDQIVDGVTPVHLKEHMEQQWPVTIIFHWSNAILIIDEITD